MNKSVVYFKRKFTLKKDEFKIRRAETSRNTLLKVMQRG